MFNDRVIIITGGSSGIGKAIAEKLVKRSAHIALVARDENKLRLVMEELKKTSMQGQKIESFSCDVANANAVQETVKSIVNTLGQVDVLINSAGILRESYFENQTLETYREIMDINFFGTLNFIKSCLPVFKKLGEGRIVNICSMAGVFGVFGYSGYCSSKHAVKGLTQTLRCELKPQGIKVHIVYPPETDTPMVDEVNTYRSVENYKLANTIPMLFTADKVADATIRGMEKECYEIIPGLLPKISILFDKLFPALTRTAVDKRIKKYYHGP